MRSLYDQKRDAIARSLERDTRYIGATWVGNLKIVQDDDNDGEWIGVLDHPTRNESKLGEDDLKDIFATSLENPDIDFRADVIRGAYKDAGVSMPFATQEVA